MSTCNMGGFGGKLCHKCPLSNYDNLTLAKWWLMDEENRWRDKTRRRLLFLLLLKSSLLSSSQGNFYYCILKMMCIYFREIDVNFAAPIFETFLKWIRPFEEKKIWSKKLVYRNLNPIKHCSMWFFYQIVQVFSKQVVWYYSWAGSWWLWYIKAECCLC